MPDYVLHLCRILVYQEKNALLQDIYYELHNLNVTLIFFSRTDINKLYYLNELKHCLVEASYDEYESVYKII
ncbi:hypothetical protein V1477_000366 [Vespula maculifrons]|uniref:Uncharacterized protein n=1 Tax=Vespula maculifrons TaxID=7453 RepID=A0ABD2D1D7_VESMC